MNIKRKKTRAWLLGLLLLAAALAFAACGTAAAAPAAETTEPPVPETAAVETGALPPEPAASPEETPEPTPAPTPEPTPSPEPTPVYTGPDLPEQPPADDTYFTDTAFFGNSLIRGLWMYGGLEEYADFYGANSAAVYNVATTMNSTLRDGTPSTLLDALGEAQYGKVYILLGINEIGLNTADFITGYGRVLDEIAAREKDAQIIIMSLSPVTQSKSEDESVFTEERVLEYNAALYALAAERQCYYVDLVEALAGEDGYLAEEVSTDGIHLTKETYPIWANYLRTHYLTDSY